MKKTFYLLLMLLTFGTVKAQFTLTPAFTIPYPLPEYNGTYQKFGQNHYYYPNAGEIRFADESQTTAGDVVKYYTKFTYPAEFLLNDNSMAFVSFRRDTVSGVLTDSLHRIDMQMYRGNGSAFLARVDTQNTCVLNYLTQWFSSGARTNVMGGASIVVQNIYTNIDMVYCSNNAGVKIFYIVYPGGNPNDIVLHFNGAKSTGISGNDLIVKSNWDEMKFVKPQMYQYTYSGGVVTPVNVCNASWQSAGMTDMYQITTSSSWSNSLPLIVEVSQGVVAQNSITGLKWSTYFGGSMQDYIYKSRSDAGNNLFVAGSTTSPNFPVSAGPMVVTTVIGSLPVNALTADGFVAKFNPSGILQWVTYVGGSGAEEIYNFDFKGSDIYCVGYTTSNDLLTQTKSGALNNSSYFGGVSDGFVFQLDAGGQTYPWLTYFGGNGEDIFTACMFDTTGAFFVVGESSSTNMTPVGAAGTYTQNYNTAQINPITPDIHDCIIIKFNAGTSNIDWFTFYGTYLHTAPYGMNYADDEFFGIDISGTNLYACGYSGGTNLPGSINSKMLANFYDGILTKFTTAGVLVSAKYTNGNARNNAVKVINGKVYTVGLAEYGLTLKNSGKYYYDSICTLYDEDGCFAVHNLNLDTTYHCTYLGDQSYDEVIDIQPDINGNGLIYISGATQALYFPTTSIGGMYSSSLVGFIDYFVVAFRENDTNLVYGTYIGSPNLETNGNGQCASIALDNQGYLTLCGATDSPSLFLTEPDNGTPYFQLTSASNPTNLSTFNGTITRLDLASVDTWVGIKDFSNTSFSFGLYPNPTSNYLVVDNKALLNQDLKYAIYDLQGKKLREGTLNTIRQKNIDVSALQQGVYIINVSNGTRTFSNKFVKVEN